jgi:hypothetical protein
MRMILGTVAAVAVSTAALAQEPITLRVAGNLLATGLIQQTKEQPFFENLAKTTGLPLAVDYKPMDVIGIKDAEGLRVLKSGLFDIVTLRVAQVSRDEPFLLGADLVGLDPNYEVAPQGGGCLPRRLRQASAGALQRQALGDLALRPAGPVLQCCDQRPRRSQGQEGAGLRSVAREVH